LLPCVQHIASKSTFTVQLPTYTENVALPTYAAVHNATVPVVQQSIDISCPLGPQQQTHCMLLQEANGSDGWTLYCFIDPAPREFLENSKNYLTCDNSSIKGTLCSAKPGCQVAQLVKCLATSDYPDGSRSGGPKRA